MVFFFKSASFADSGIKSLKRKVTMLSLRDFNRTFFNGFITF